MKQKNKIPKDWQKLKIKKCLTICHGKSQHEVEDKNGKYPILGSGGIIGFANKYIYNKPSVLIGRKGTIDIPRYMDSPFWTVDTLFYSIVNKGFSAKFLYYLFNTINWYRYNEASGVPSLSASTIMNIECIVPPIKEQEKIVEILELWDKAIETTKKLIEQKQLQKKYLMQKLLTSKIRMKGFKDKWKKYNLGDICDFISGFSFSSNDFCDKGILLIKISNISNGKIVLSDEDVCLPIDYIYKYNQFVIKQYDLLIAMSGATTGKLAINTSDKKLLLNQRVGIIRALKSNQNFINQYLFAFKNKFLKMSYGGAQPNISSEDIKKIIIYIPQNLTEQKAIAEVLSTADKQIDLLKQKLSNLELQKKGLMQKLLTGKIRVGR
ncbi:MAG: restriction endonuclease subunit S [Elusimicrobia bacterium]|nr:restriction endonuclease subunit S [Elusimicrobiota bacterium]